MKRFNLKEYKSRLSWPAFVFIYFDNYLSSMSCSYLWILNKEG